MNLKKVTLTLEWPAKVSEISSQNIISPDARFLVLGDANTLIVKADTKWCLSCGQNFSKCNFV